MKEIKRNCLRKDVCVGKWINVVDLTDIESVAPFRAYIRKIFPPRFKSMPQYRKVIVQERAGNQIEVMSDALYTDKELEKLEARFNFRMEEQE